jgi:hypothetical protein
MISHPYRFIFIHIPKTGGTSIEKYFGEFDIDSNYKHRTHNYFLGNLPDYSNYHKFTIVRNPFDLLVSQFKWNCSIRAWSNFFNKDTSFEDYLNKIISFNYNDVKHLRSKHKKTMWINKSFFHNNIDIQKKQQLDILKPVDKLDTILRFENIQDDFTNLCECLNIPIKKLPHLNKTNRKHYSEYYTDKTRKIVNERFKDDIEYFGYKFESE